MIKLVKYEKNCFRFLITYQDFLFKFPALKDILSQPGVRVEAGVEFVAILIEDKGPIRQIKKLLWELATILQNENRVTMLDDFVEALNFLSTCKRMGEGDEE